MTAVYQGQQTTPCACGGDAFENEPEGSCLYAMLGYPFCLGCGDHHRAPVAEREGERCPVDVMVEADE